MRAGAALGCLAVLALALAALVGLAGLGATMAPPREANGPLPSFARFEEPEAFELTFGFLDHHGRPHRVQCQVSRTDFEAERAAFGFDEDEHWERVRQNMRLLIGVEIERRRLEPYFHFTVQGRGEYSWKWTVGGEVGPPEHARAVSAARDLEGWLRNSFPTRVEALRADLLRRHGFLLADGRLRIDYATLVASGTRTLADCHRTLVTSGAGSDQRRYLGEFLAFFQDLTYEIPPEREGRRFTLGLWVPTEVLVRGRGDCDSKAVGFSAMWRRFGKPLLFILLPHHALVAVEMRPGPGENHVRLGNRYFVLCEVAGPAKSHPGSHPVSGDWSYVLIEPV